MLDLNLVSVAVTIGIALVALLLCLLLGVATNFLRKRMSAEQWELFSSKALETVAAVEQMWASGQIEKSKRFQEAMKLLLAVCPGLDYQEARLLLESSVKKSKDWLIETR